MKPSLAALILLFFVQAHLSAQFMYNVTDLGTLGGTSSIANGINGSGQIAGTSYLTEDQAQGAYLSGAAGALPLRYLGGLGGDTSYGQAINSSGQVAGIGLLSDNVSYHAFLSATNGGSLSDLGTLGGLYSYGYGVNAKGRVAGSSLIAGNSAYHAFLSGENGGALLDLGLLSGGTNSYAFAVNSSGQAVGYADDATGYNQAFISDPNGGALHSLGALDGRYSFAFAVNDSGQVVGRYETRFGQHAFISDANGGQLHDLGTLGGYSSYGESINAAGSVTGYSFLGDNSTQHAFLYKSSTGMVDLNSLVSSGANWVLNDAKGINDSGLIVGYGTIGGQKHAFLLTPILPDVHLTSVSRARDGTVLVQGVGVPLKIHTVQTTSNLAVAFATAGTIMADGNGVIQFEDTGAGADTKRFYRITYP